MGWRWWWVRSNQGGKKGWIDVGGGGKEGGRFDKA